jgi:hypothetical protein
MSRLGTVNLVPAAAAFGLVLVIGAGGGAVAAVSIGSKQIADNSIRSRDVRDGTLLAQDLDEGTRAAMRGATGATGATGTDGSTGQQGPAGPAGQAGADATVQVLSVNGAVQNILPNNGAYVFAGPTAQITTTAAHPRVSGTASASLGLQVGSPPGFADIGMCSQPVPGSLVSNLVGSNFSTEHLTVDRVDFTASASVVMAAGTYKVGMCVRNNGTSTISNNNYVNGWVMVTS